MSKQKFVTNKTKGPDPAYIVLSDVNGKEITRVSCFGPSASIIVSREGDDISFQVEYEEYELKDNSGRVIYRGS